MINNGERGSGHVVSETRQVNGFRALEVSYPAQVIVRQSSQESLDIEAEDNLLPGLKTEVDNGVLRIFYKIATGKRVHATKPVKIRIVANDLREIAFTSAGELLVEAFKTDALDVALSGAGNLHLNDVQLNGLQVNLSGAGSVMTSGRADSLHINISGFGDFKGTDLHGRDTDINISGAGSATVWADRALTANISGAGSINYYGSASVTKQISGAGRVRHLGSK